MIDASSKSFEENIALTKQVVEYAHAHGVVVEAELGTLAGIEDEVVVEAGQESYTRPEEVEEFVTEQAAIPLLSQSERAMALTSSQLISAQEMQMASLFRHHFVSTFWKSALRDCRDSRSFFTVLLLYRRSSLRWLTSTAEICRMQ